LNVIDSSIERFLFIDEEPENGLKQHCEKLKVQWNNVWLLTLDRQKKIQEAKASIHKEPVSRTRTTYKSRIHRTILRNSIKVETIKLTDGRARRKIDLLIRPTS